MSEGNGDEASTSVTFLAGIEDTDNPKEFTQRVSEEIGSFDQPVIVRVSIAGAKDYTRKYGDMDTAASEILSRLDENEES